MTDNDGRLRFSWNAAKADANLRRHGVRFETAAEVFGDPSRLEDDDRFAQGEYRTIVIGRADVGVLTVVYAEPTADEIRIISARRATATERRTYEQNRLQP